MAPAPTRPNVNVGLGEIVGKDCDLSVRTSMAQ